VTNSLRGPLLTLLGEWGQGSLGFPSFGHAARLNLSEISPRHRAPRSSKCTAAERLGDGTFCFCPSQPRLTPVPGSICLSILGFLARWTGRYVGSLASPFGYSHKLHSLPCVTLPPYTPDYGQGNGGHDPAKALARLRGQGPTTTCVAGRLLAWGRKSPLEKDRVGVACTVYSVQLYIHTYVYTMFGRSERNASLKVATRPYDNRFGYFSNSCACQTLLLRQWDSGESLSRIECRVVHPGFGTKLPRRSPGKITLFRRNAH